MTSLEEFRVEKDTFFANEPQSPLTPEQKHEFHGLNYFPENPQLRLKVNVEKFPGKEKIQMQTSTGDIQTYTRYGLIKFTMEGKEVELTIYSDRNGYFLPFVDSLAGKDTYPAGRYLEPEALPNGQFLVDFNMAYNPYCAYNEMWSCPLTPFENHLNVPIKAGEKRFHD
ncbi:MAG TPA: DUF1684 domain-containing protein [Anaerolineaceae bacterium]|nr:DUF1684 domain-containing protein [Anaerolineaceae bacterium]